MQLNSCELKNRRVQMYSYFGSETQGSTLCVHLSLKRLRTQSPSLLKPEAFSYQPQAVRGVMSSVCPSPIGVQRRECRSPALPPAQACRARPPAHRGHLKDSPAPRDTLRRERGIRRAARGRGGGMEGGATCASRQDAGRRGGLRTGF